MAPLHDAVRAGDVEALRRELERGISPDTLEYGMTPLYTAANVRSNPSNVSAHMKQTDCISLLGSILGAGSFEAYERAHLEALTRTLSPKLAHLLPPELVRKVVEFYLHAGFYPFTAAKVPATAPAA